MYLYIHKYSIHVYKPRRMAFETGRGGSGLEPKPCRTSADPGGFSADAAAGPPRTSDGSWPDQAPDHPDPPIPG